MEENIECGGFLFYNNFDSANLAKVEKVEVNKADNGKGENNKTQKSSAASEIPNYEFNLWTKHDCHGTEFQNNNKTWFHFGIKSPLQSVYVKLNLVNLNKHIKMFSQGMSPVFKVIPGHPHWERIREKTTFIADEKNNEFVVSFNYRTSENPNAVTYFAFTYPFSYTDLQNHLKKIDTKMSKQTLTVEDDIYYHRECAINSLEGRRLDVLTISSYYNILTEREAKIKDLFPIENEKRPYKFHNKKIIFISARVHPGETPSSFVLNGFLNFLLNRDDQIAVTLRRLYVFKLIPMLNPDGVAQGYYRMDTRGVNLNRLYLNPSKIHHPTIFAAKTLLRYYHHVYTLPDDRVPEISNKTNTSTFDTTKVDTKKIDTPRIATPRIDTTKIDATCSINSISSETNKLLQRVTLMSLEEKKKCIERGSRVRNCLSQASEKPILKPQGNKLKSIESLENMASKKLGSKQSERNPEDSGIFLYIDFHGHASKKGIFMYGNHFDDPEDSSDCMLLPKLMSINNSNFHFTSCNFAERNMYLVDKRDGLSREGSGRVAVYKLTGLIHSYTLECNYNTGRLVNTVPGRVKDGKHKTRGGQLFVPPKYTPVVFEEVGAALGPSILDMTGNNPNSRIPNSQYRSLKGLKSYLKLISTNHFQTSLTKPLLKNNSSDSSDETIDKPSKFNFASSSNLSAKNDSQKATSKITASYLGAIRKLKINIKKSRTSMDRASQKFAATAETRNINRRDNKVSVPKVISTHVQSKCKLVNSTLKKGNVNTKPNFSTKNNEPSNKLKKIDRNSRTKLPVKSILKKPIVYAKRGMIKKPGPQKSKTTVLTKMRHKFQIDLIDEASKLNTVKTACVPHSKQKNKNNIIIKNKKQFVKSEHRSPKKSSISKV